jgi:hypothetical protein
MYKQVLDPVSHPRDGADRLGHLHQRWSVAFVLLMRVLVPLQSGALSFMVP